MSILDEIKERYKDISKTNPEERLKKIAEFQQMEVKSGRAVHTSVHLDKRLNLIVRALSNKSASTRKTSLTSMITELIYKGILLTDYERSEQGLPSLLEMVSDFDTKESIKTEKKLKKQIMQENINLTNKVWGFDKK